jgi:hypothetical protein
MLLREYKNGPSALFGLFPISNVDFLETTPTKAADTITMLSPGDDDDASDEDGDWSDIDDEDFEDMAEDQDDLHEMELDNDIFDPADDDHLPDDDDD